MWGLKTQHFYEYNQHKWSLNLYFVGQLVTSILSLAVRYLTVNDSYEKDKSEAHTLRMLNPVELK